MEAAQAGVFNNFEESLKEFSSSSNLTRQEKAAKLASQIDILAQTREGLVYLYEQSTELDRLGFFVNTSWNEPDKLAPALVKGTLRIGHPSSSFEILSELRILAIANGLATSEKLSAADAIGFLEEVIVHNLEFALNEVSEESRVQMSARELKKAHNLFGFLMDEINLDGVYEKLAEEVRLVCSQRPIVTRTVRELIRLIDQRFDVSGNTATDLSIRTYIEALYAPSPWSKGKSFEDYTTWLSTANIDQLETEARSMGYYLNETGLISEYHAVFLRFLIENHDRLIPQALSLNDSGEAEWNKFKLNISTLILEIVHPDNAQCIYGLSLMLNRTLFSRRALRVGVENLRKIKINAKVADRIIKSTGKTDTNVTALQFLIGGVIKVLGQPLGVGQGNNPTCQSARGISMWSQHAPAKLIDMVITVATQNNLIMRFENQELESNKLEKGLVQKLDHNLDVVSVVLVPHLDRIYNEMMRRSMGRTDDPHKWVNPAMYGHWIQVGFASCYDYLSNSIMDYEGFIRIFYAAFHLDYNDNRQVVYPIPIGIFITSNKGEMLGFHAISLLRVDRDESRVMRAYFLNPNNEGRQDWGQQILPSVSGHREWPGESSLPFHEFAARIYAFHYSPLDVNAHLQNVPNEELQTVRKLAEGSWGKSYTWNNQIKLW
jgi:hypothetical protein